MNRVTDYNNIYFKLVDARCQLAGIVTSMEGYLKAVDNNQERLKEICFELLKEDILEAKNMIDKGIHDEECETE